ncbi:MAG: flagellar M-ring protein FliF, partial [Bdellovibrionales bacterium]|nr:flagellar M-ring protein FliF [Bdellovibrionales bacterium]
MNKLFAGLVLQYREFFKNLGPTKRVSILMVSGILAVALISIVLMISGKDYVPLLTNVPPDQMPLIVQKLNEKNIPFQLKEEGKTIAIPKELLHSTQMTLMSEIGSAKLGTIGLEIFDKQDFGVNSYAQKINFQRAMQGELIRAINTL